MKATSLLIVALQSFHINKVMCHGHSRITIMYLTLLEENVFILNMVKLLCWFCTV